MSYSGPRPLTGEYIECPFAAGGDSNVFIESVDSGEEDVWPGAYPDEDNGVFPDDLQPFLCLVRGS